MKKMRKLLAMLLVLVTVLTIVPVSASAATSYLVIKSGKTFSLKTELNASRVENNHYYKLTLTTDSLVKFAWSGNTKNGAYVEIYADSARSKRVTGLSTLYGNASGSETLALGKGTYYINMYDGYCSASTTATTKMTVTVTNQSEVNRSNYCRANALTLSSGKWIKIAQTPHYSYGRWYKITTTKSQKIHINANKSYEYYFRIYDKNMNLITMDGSSPATTKTTCAAGTYYIYVDDVSYFGDTNRLGVYINFKWY